MVILSAFWIVFSGFVLVVAGLLYFEVVLSGFRAWVTF